MACLLVITEQVEQRRAWRRLFVYAGYAVMDAHHGDEGMRYLQAHVIDLVVLELGMPSPPGVATLRALRAGAPALRLLVLLDPGVLGQIDAGLLAQLTDADRVLEQPVTEPALLAAVRELLAMP
jgi:DNA-binding response OmpR family regulator